MDAAGSAYITGSTNSMHFPAKGAYQATSGGAEDVFVSKLSPRGNELVYSTYLGGAASDRAQGVSGAVIEQRRVLGSWLPGEPGEIHLRGTSWEANVAEYTPGGNTPAIDEVLVTDSLGNTATAEVTLDRTTTTTHRGCRQAAGPISVDSSALALLAALGLATRRRRRGPTSSA